MSTFSLCLIIGYTMVLNNFEQTISEITTCIGNRPWTAPVKRTGYQNLSTIHPIQVVSKQGPADDPFKHQNGVNHSNLSKLTLTNRNRTDVSSLLINARSIRSNGHTIRHQIEHKKPEIVAITETWNTTDDGDFLSQIRPPMDTNGAIWTDQKQGVGASPSYTTAT